MQKIPLKLATAGMVLARDVFRNGSAAGFPVCGKSTILTESLISRFDNMDIATIYVEGHPHWEEGDRSLDDMLGDLEHRFSKVQKDPLMAVLHNTYADYYKSAMGVDSGRQTE